MVGVVSFTNLQIYKLYIVRLLFVYFGVNEDASAEFADNDFFTLTDVELPLCGYFAVASSATVSFYFDHRESVVCVFADAFESGEEPVVDAFLYFSGANDERFGLGFGLREDGVEFALFLVEVDGFFLNVGNGFRLFGFVCLQLFGVVVYFFLAEFDVELLVFDFLVEIVEFAVVSDGVLLLFVPCDGGVGVLGAYAVVGDLCFAVFDAVLDVVEACFESFNLVSHILYLLWQFAGEGAQFVDTCVNLLQFVEGFEFLLYGEFLFLFSSHNCI